ncbi:hypothetical protein RJ639_018243, partial [Escallonia herrerae]
DLVVTSYKEIGCVEMKLRIGYPRNAEFSYSPFLPPDFYSKLVLEDRNFWLQCQHVVKFYEPLVRVLRLTDGDKKPSMGYLYEANDKANETFK